MHAARWGHYWTKQDVGEMLSSLMAADAWIYPGKLFFQLCGKGEKNYVSGRPVVRFILTL